MVSPPSTPPEVYENPRTPLRRFSAAIGLIFLLSIPIAMVTFLQRAGGIHQLRPGDQVPPLSLKSLDSMDVSIPGRNGKRAVLLFFSVECPRCQQEISNFEKLFRSFKDKYVFTGVSSGSARQTKNFLNARDITFPIFLDDNGEARRAFGVFEVPTLFLVRANGVIAFRASGVEASEARRRLAADIAGDEEK